MKKRIEPKRKAPAQRARAAAPAPASARPTRAGREAERDRLMSVLRQGHFVTAAQLAELHNAEHRDAWLLSSDVEMHLKVLLGRGAVVKADSDVRTRWAAAPLESIDDGIRVEVRTYLAETDPGHAGRWRVLRRDPGLAGKVVICASVESGEAEACVDALNEVVRARLAREARPAIDRRLLVETEEATRGPRMVNIARLALGDRGARWVADLMREPYLDCTYAYMGTRGFWRLVTEVQMAQLGELVANRGAAPSEHVVAEWLANGDAGVEIDHDMAARLRLDLGLDLGPGIGLERVDEPA